MESVTPMLRLSGVRGAISYMPRSTRYIYGAISNGRGRLGRQRRMTLPQGVSKGTASSWTVDAREEWHVEDEEVISELAVAAPADKVHGNETRDEVTMFVLGGLAAVGTHYVLRFLGTLPVIRDLVKRFIWWAEPKLRSKDSVSLLWSSSDAEAPDGDGGAKEPSSSSSSRWRGNVVPYAESGLISIKDEKKFSLVDIEGGETVEWVNMCWRKAWRVYQRGLERWLADLLQPVFDSLVQDKMVPAFVQKLRITEFTLDHEAPYFTNMRRRSSRKDSDLNGVVDVRYTGGARMVLSIEIGTKNRYSRLKVPVMVSDLDLECRLWLKLRLAPMCPYIGTMSLAFVGPPTIKVQLSPYDRIKLMRIPVIQPFLTKLFTVDLPRLMTLPNKLDIAIPPAVTAVAEAAVGRDAVMRAVASAVLQADALEHALVSALPLGPQGAAGGISLPDLFRGELLVTLKGAKDLPVWGFPWQSNPYCRLALGAQAVMSRKDNETSQPSRHRGPVWNQEFQFLVEDSSVQALEIWIMDSPITGRTDVAYAKIPLSELPSTGAMDAWFDLKSSMPAETSGGSVRMSLTYKPFQDDDIDSGYREAAAQAFSLEEDRPDSDDIIDVKTAADASSRAAVAASAAAAAVAVTKAAAARAAARLSRMATEANENKSEDDGDTQKAPEEQEQQEQQERVEEPERDIMVRELNTMAETMHHLEDEITALNEGGNGASTKAVELLSTAESRAVSAMNEGDVHKANEILEDAAETLEEHIRVSRESHQHSNGAEEDDHLVSGQEKAERAITAARAAAQAAAIAVTEADSVRHSTIEEENKPYHIISDSEDSWGTDATPSTSSPKTQSKPTLPQNLEEQASDDEQQSEAPWWNKAAGWVMSHLGKKDTSERDTAVEDADGSAVNTSDMSWFDYQNLTPEDRRRLPVGDIVLGDDIPIEEIAAEVQKSWKLRDVHVETLVQKALEARQRQNELPLLLITSIMATSSAILLSIVLYRLLQSN
ncbi:hypothetical protein M9434_003508 [Picochlorum sp. BPE23]|nr:hypothetical protein M9434_003508 [Picochlorum sp. BPE23]